MTVRARCQDAGPTRVCKDEPGLGLDGRRASLEAECSCLREQHYQYRWDELNRLAEARRWDRGGTGDWVLEARQRYRYDHGNQRIVKETLAPVTGTPPAMEAGASAHPFDRVALTIYPGEYERRGLERDVGGLDYEPSSVTPTETQYVVGHARAVFEHDKPSATPKPLDRDFRLTYALTDLLQSAAAVVDLESGTLLERSTYYPNGAQETHLTQHTEGVPPEVRGFTGKEADSEVGLVYFGERYLIPRLGRWASPDPLSIHAAGGGEALNGYHYVGGNLLEARDPVGLDFTQTADNPGVSNDQFEGTYTNGAGEEVAMQCSGLATDCLGTFEDAAFTAGVQDVGAELLEGVTSGLELVKDPEALARFVGELAWLVATVKLAREVAYSINR